MLIPLKHDSANGEVGTATEFGARESEAVDRLRREILRDPGYVPDKFGAVPAFESFVAGFYLLPEEGVVGLMLVYLDIEVLRRSLFFTTMRIPLSAGNPFMVAQLLMRGEIREKIQAAIRERRFSVELDERLLGRPRRLSESVDASSHLRDLSLVKESDLSHLLGSQFFPFVTFKPAEGGDLSVQSDGATPRDREGHATSNDLESESALVDAASTSNNVGEHIEVVQERSETRLKHGSKLQAIILSIGVVNLALLLLLLFVGPTMGRHEGNVDPRVLDEVQEMRREVREELKEKLGSLASGKPSPAKVCDFFSVSVDDLRLHPLETGDNSLGKLASRTIVRRLEVANRHLEVTKSRVRVNVVIGGEIKEGWLAKQYIVEASDVCRLLGL